MNAAKYQAEKSRESAKKSIRSSKPGRMRLHSPGSPPCSSCLPLFRFCWLPLCPSPGGDGFHSSPLKVVPEVDLARYAGTWYEIARFPNRFQNQCTRIVTATYTLLEDEQIKVVNRCRTEEGTFEEAEGRPPQVERHRPSDQAASALCSSLPVVSAVCLGGLSDHRSCFRL